jgi:hypothetical protein
MHTGYSGATYIYTCCIVGKVHICGKIIFLSLGFVKKGLEVYMGKWKKALCARLHGVRQILL